MSSQTNHTEPTADAVLARLDEVDREFQSLNAEIDLLRKRDHTFQYHMQRLDDELRMAARLQRDFLPKAMPTVGPVRFAALFRPAGYVSGDLYDVVRLDETHVGFYVADAVGHGVPAALLTMFIKHALATKEIVGNRYRLIEPGETLTRLNASLIEQGLTTGTFCTACYGVIDTQTLEMQVACGGHPAPLLLRKDEPPVSLAAEGPLLGVFEGEQFRTFHHQLRPGDRFVIHTDGVELAYGPAPETAPTARFMEELFKHRLLGAEHLANQLAQTLDWASGSLDPQDDLTVVVGEILPTA